MSTSVILLWLHEACLDRKHSELNLDGSTGDDQDLTPGNCNREHGATSSRHFSFR
ncbi:MAG: hypothetical protein V7608_5949 [Hyphomicrobiales bacterium]|jgi:hypothetical protein